MICSPSCRAKPRGWRSYLLRYLPPRQTPRFYSEEPHSPSRWGCA